MNTTTTPGFTAEASLYKTSRHYRTSYHALDLPGHTVAIRPSEIDVPGEVIEIEDDAPWSPPSWGGHTGPGTTSPPPETGGGEPGGGSDGGTTPEDSGGNSLPFSRGCSVDQDQSPAGKSCLGQFDIDVANGVPRRYRHYLKCTGKAKGGVQHPKVECCQLKRVGSKIQEVCDQMTFV